MKTSSAAMATLCVLLSMEAGHCVPLLMVTRVLPESRDYLRKGNFKKARYS